MSYWDTSTLVKLYADEPDSVEFEKYAMTSTGKAVTSRITLFEAHATFARKEAEAMLGSGCAQQLYRHLTQDITVGELELVELGAEVEREYGQVLSICYRQIPPIPIRTLDALHLASARVAGETEVVATDKRVRSAAKILGFSLFPL